MSTEVDPLLALRQAKSRTTITYSNDSGPCSSLPSATQLVFSGTQFPKAGWTRYRKPGTPSEFYLLHALYVAWLLREAPGAEYMKQRIVRWVRQCYGATDSQLARGQNFR